MSKVKNIDGSETVPDSVEPEQMLQELSVNPDLEHFQIVCHWKDGTTSTGWSHGIKGSKMALGMIVLEEAVKVAIFCPDRLDA